VSYCPECEAEIDGEFEEVGDLVSCPECGVDLEVISLDPVEFDLAPIADEDDDDEFDSDDKDDDEDDWEEDDDDLEEDEDKDKEDGY
jgi:alpha-aminoadipate carrier protein LysW